jgi:hypothetical protein
MTREEALERASRLVPRTWELLQECRTVRLTLEDETFPPPDAATEAETKLRRPSTAGPLRPSSGRYCAASRMR